MTLPRDTPISRLAALALLVVVLVAAASVTIAPLAAWRSEIADEVQEKRETLGRLLAVAADAGRAQDLTRLGQSLSQDGATFIEGATDSIRSANLQGLVAQIARDNGIRIDVARALPPKDRDELRSLGVEVRFEGSIAAVQNFLIGLETARPLLFVRSASLSSRRAGSGIDEAGAAPLDVRFEIAAVARPKEIAP